LPKSAKVFAPLSEDDALLAKVKALRSQGVCVIQALNSQDKASDFSCTEHLVLENGAWQQRAV
jgi:hypothetical protein